MVDSGTNLTNKDKARAYHKAVSEYDIATVERMVHENYIQHNPHVPTGRAAFVALLPKLKKHDSRIENLRMIEDGSYVVMHHLWKNAIPFGTNEMVAFHIIRFDESGLIAEHWNVMMENIPSNVSGSSLVEGETEVRDLDKTDANKSKIKELLALLVEQSSEGLLNMDARFFHANYRHYNSAAQVEAREFVNPARASGEDPIYQKLHKIFGEGSFVLTVSEGEYQGHQSALYDLFRLENGKIAEHWSIYQEIPIRNLANTNTMFNFS